MCGSPRLIAACHVLHRLLMPRHSPCALISLTSSAQISYRSLPCQHKSSLTPSRLLSKSKPLRWVSIWCGASRRLLSIPSTPRSRGDFRFSQELCRPQIWFIVVLCYPLFLNSTKFTLLPLCCLLAISCLLHCSVFKVQLPTFSKVRSKHSGIRPNASI